MSSSPELRVLRGTAQSNVVPAVMDEDVASLRFAAGPDGIDPRLVDPRLRVAFTAAVEEMREVARREGFAAGYAAGSLQAEAEAEQAAADREVSAALARQAAARETEQALGALWHAVEECNTRDALSLSSLEETAIETALSLASALLGREVAAGADATADMLSAAMALVDGESRIVLRVSPSEAAAVRALLAGHPRIPEVRADASVPAGGGYVDCGATTVDARLSAALERVRYALGHPASLVSMPAPAPSSAPPMTAAIPSQRRTVDAAERVA